MDRGKTSGPGANEGTERKFPAGSEAFDEIETPPLTPLSSTTGTGTLPLGGSPSSNPTRKSSRSELHLEKGQVADMDFERPFYEIIVDGIHSHPNSVRVSPYLRLTVFRREMM